MRITGLSPMAATHTSGRGPMSYLFVRVDTDDGVRGYGEACDSFGCSYPRVVGAVIEHVYAPLLVGQELDSVAMLVERLRAHTRRRLGDQWIATQALSAVEIALHDALGKARGRSVSELLGRVRDATEIYASWRFLEDGTAEWHAGMLAPVIERGIRLIKLRLGPEWRRDLGTLRELRGLLDRSVALAVDGSETFTLSSALEIAHQLADLGVSFFEEPLPQYARAGIEELARRSPVPIAYGEHLFGRHDAADALRRRQLDVLQPDAATCGGINEAREMALLAASAGIRVLPHNCAGPIALAANLHVAGSTPHVRLMEFDVSGVPGRAALAGSARLGLDAITDGRLPIPDGPGLGVDLDEDAVAGHPHVPLGANVAGTRSGLPDRFVGDR